LSGSDFFASLKAELTAFSAKRSPVYLREALSSGCFVYGAGGYGRRILALLREQNITCAGIIDRKFTGDDTRLDGVPAFHPDALLDTDVMGKCLAVGVHNHLVDPGAFLDYGLSRPFREILWNADLPDALGGKADNYWLTNRQFMLAHFDELEHAAKYLSDQTSIEILVALVRYRITGDISAAPKSKIDEQYLPPDLISFEMPITFVDGGAYNGDTHRYLTAKGVSVAHWVAFEPDPRNFGALSEVAGSLLMPSTLFPCGLSDTFVHVPFAANADASSHLSDSSVSADITVPCVALDEVLPGLRPDYIKLDIEGAEQAALFGMRKTIAACHPHLAISVYHRPEDLWTLVHTLLELAPYANLYLRQHCLNAFDTVLYAIPRA
jgi:FkbM family methyltransferase